VSIKYIYSNPDLFDRLESSKKNTLATTGKSLLWAEGEDHKRLRKIMVPSFGPAPIREIVPVFLEKSYQLKDKLLALSNEKAGEGKQGEVDISKWMSRATVDIIGLAGFDYDFDSVHEEGNELLKAWGDMQRGRDERGWLSLLQFAGVPLSDRLFVS